MDKIDFTKPFLTTYEVCELLNRSPMSISRMRNRIEQTHRIKLNTNLIPTYLVLLDIGYPPEKVKELTGF